MTVSIIIPVYNARRYLRNTAGDLLRQSYSDLEVIFVDDGSTDGSAGWLDRLADQDERVCVLHQENGGTARARNTGMAAASGKYLMFMDDDDRIPKGYVQEYVSAIEKSGADVVIGGYQRVTPEGQVLFSRRLIRSWRPSVKVQMDGQKQPDDTGDTADRIQEPGWLAYINVAPWAKIYRRSFVEESGARFLEYPYGEDIYFQMMLQAKHPVIAYCSSIGYRWMDWQESISNTLHKGMRKEADIFPMLDQLLAVHPERGDLFRYFLYRHCAYHIYTSGRDARSENLVREFGRCEEWLEKNALLPVLSPFSSRLKGEILRDRIAVCVIRWTVKLHLQKLFAKIYCRDR